MEGIFFIAPENGVYYKQWKKGLFPGLPSLLPCSFSQEISSAKIICLTSNQVQFKHLENPQLLLTGCQHPKILSEGVRKHQLTSCTSMPAISKTNYSFQVNFIASEKQHLNSLGDSFSHRTGSYSRSLPHTVRPMLLSLNLQ